MLSLYMLIYINISKEADIYINIYLNICINSYINISKKHIHLFVFLPGSGPAQRCRPGVAL